MNLHEIEQLRNKTIIIDGQSISLGEINENELFLATGDEYDTCLCFGSWIELGEEKDEKTGYEVKWKDGETTRVVGSLTCEMTNSSPHDENVVYSSLFDIKIAQTGEIWTEMIYCSKDEDDEEEELSKLEANFCVANLNKKIENIEKEDLLLLEETLDFEFLTSEINDMTQNIAEKSLIFEEVEKNLQETFETLNSLDTLGENEHEEE